MTVQVKGEQCTATAKGSGARCKRMVVGGGVCPMHGGNAPQVRAAREVRILTAQAAGETPVSAADAATVLLGAMNDSHALLQTLKTNIAEGRLTATDLAALGEWMDRSSRLAKAVVDAGIDERRQQLAEAQGQLLVAAIQRILARLELSASQQALVPVVVPAELRAIAAVSEGVRDAS